MASKVFVGNLNFKTAKEELEGLFGQAGPVAEVFLPMDRETGRPRGFAFVTFQNDEDAAKAIEKFNGYELGGRALRVNAAEDRPPRRSFTPGGGGGGYANESFGGGDRDFGGGDFGGGYGGGYGGGGGKAKGSRRNIRAKKRQL